MRLKKRPLGAHAYIVALEKRLSKLKASSLAQAHQEAAEDTEEKEEEESEVEMHQSLLLSIYLYVILCFRS